MGNEIKEFVVAVFKHDKTPGYGYSGKERDQTRFGHAPRKPGQRWLTPAELALAFAKEHGFEQDLFAPATPEKDGWS